MHVYVESNFVLELACSQAEYENCERILALSREARITLRIPAFCLVEPYQTLERRRRERSQLRETLDVHRRQIERSQLYSADARQLAAFSDLLVRSAEEDRLRVGSIREEIVSLGATIPLDATTIALATNLQETFGMPAEDSIVLAGVETSLEAEMPSLACFVTKNSKDFSDPDVEQRLAAKNCKLLFGFEQAESFILAALRAER